MQIVNRTPALPERGKIKIGMKGEKRTSKAGKEFSPPVKLDHFIITTMERDSNDNFLPDLDLMAEIAEATEQNPASLTRIPVRLLYNDPGLDFASRYAAYGGRSLWCSGNGANAIRDGKGIDCPCERIERDFKGEGPKCKINGILSVLIDGARGIGGVWKLRTTSFNSVDGLTSSLGFMAVVTGGQLANIPFDLVLRAKQAALPDGTQQTIFVVGLEYTGSLEDLRDAGYQAALASKQANLRIEHIEAGVRKLMEVVGEEAVFSGEEAGDIVPEFYPEDEQTAAAPALQNPSETQPEDESEPEPEQEAAGAGEATGEEPPKAATGGRPKKPATAPKPPQAEPPPQAAAPDEDVF